jgi:release factor glutamine methyltransferase
MTARDLQDVIADRLRAAGCVFAEEEARLLAEAARDPDELAALADRRAAGLPLEHVLGWAEFCGLRLAVDPGVFVPRRRTEFLVEQCIAAARCSSPAKSAGGETFVVLDMCCGSGAVGAVLAEALDSVQLHAVDIDPAAVRCARRNLGARGRVYAGDLYQPLPAALTGRVDILVANAPYVPTEEVRLLPPEARTHEPLVALDGGTDGLDVLRRIVAGAPAWLARGGSLLTETSAGQAAAAVESVSAAGLTARVVQSAELGATVLIGASAE